MKSHWDTELLCQLLHKHYYVVVFFVCPQGIKTEKNLFVCIFPALNRHTNNNLPPPQKKHTHTQKKLTLRLQLETKLKTVWVKEKDSLTPPSWKQIKFNILSSREVILNYWTNYIALVRAQIAVFKQKHMMAFVRWILHLEEIKASWPLKTSVTITNISKQTPVISIP